MKNIITKMSGLILVFWIVSSVWAEPMFAIGTHYVAGADSAHYNTYRGKVMGKLNNFPLAYADITVEGENTSTVSNSHGEFVIKISKESKAENIIISHLGYKNLLVPISRLKHRHNLLRVEPVAVVLNQVYIHPGPVDQIVRNVLENIGKNYPQKPYQMTGFYREFIKKRNHYVSLSEAVVGIYKASYKSLLNDQIRIIKGRKGTNVKRMDTLLFKLQGGPATGLLLDIIKNPYVLLNGNMLLRYKFNLINEVRKNDHIYYVIQFEPINKTGVPLYSGKFYIDVNSYALASADFYLELDNPAAAAKLFIKKKPFGAKVTPTSAHYIVNYHEQNGKWYFNYAKGEVIFKIKWKRHLFSSVYATTFEMAITDREDREVVRYKPAERFKRNQIFSETVQAFSKKDYWGKYNYIEPNQSIASAIRKFKRILKK
jgi:hypothetical protein